MKGAIGLRVATYNIHKCQGFDRRVSPQRIVAVIREVDADVVCMQEVVNAAEGPAHYNQAEEIGKAFPEYTWRFGSNREHRGGTYGNMTLTRLPLRHWHNHDVTKPGREPRGVLQTDIELAGGETVHIFNVHLGTGLMERRYQAARLTGPEVLGSAGRRGARVVLGDFNEWTQGLTTRLLRSSFQTFQPQHGLRFGRTFPGMLPMMTLDHCYYEPPLQLVSTRLWRTAKALVASDHLPLVANFEIAERD